MPEAIISMLRGMLQVDPAKRITAKRALRSDAMSDVDADTRYGPPI